jgi:hypothetical protein
MCFFGKRGIRIGVPGPILSRISDTFGVQL